MVVAVAANRFQIVMLAGNPQAFLAIGNPPRGRGAHAEEIVLERDHPGIGEKQGGVALGYQRGGRDNLMPLVPEKVEKRLAYPVGSPFHAESILA